MTEHSTAPGEIGQLQELIYELDVGQVMTPNVVSVAPTDTMRQVKELLRLYRISGTPVVENGCLVGIVSTEDVIRALDERCIDSTVRDHMSRSVVAIRAEDKLAEAVRTFGKVGFGRLPVVNEKGVLVGILTPGDISGRLLTIMDRRHRQEEAKLPAPAQLIDTLVSDETTVTLRYKVANGDFKRAGEAASSIKRALQSLDIAASLTRRAAIIAYEAEMNLVIHSDGGFLCVEVSPERLTVTAEDAGPGIEDVEKALLPGFSTAPEWVREMGFGAGMGLCNIKQSSDEFHFESKIGKGTLVRAIIFLRGRP